jgi:hypothetical protein
MRMARYATFGILVLVGLLLAGPAAAKSAAFLGSLTIEGATEEQVSGFVITANPGLEKTITQQIPPLTVPVIVEGEVDEVSTSSHGGGPKFLKKNLDSLLVLTNRTDGALDLTLRLRRADGTDAGTQSLQLGAFATQFVVLSNLLQ